MSDIIDKGSWLFAALAMLFVLFVFQFTINARIGQSFDVSPRHSAPANEAAPDGSPDEARPKPQFPAAGRSILFFVSFDAFSIGPLISLSLFFIPALLILARIFGAAGYTGTNMRNNYMPLAACTMMAWTAAHLPFAAAGMILAGAPVNGTVFVAIWLASGLFFGLLTVFAVRTVLGVNYGSAVLVVAVAAFAFPLGMYVFRYVSPHLFSPFLIIMAVLYFGGFLSSEARGFGNAFRQRQNFKRFLHNATVNPRDADAHVQLALIYLQRKQDAKALEHLNKAFEIDPEEIDANYELGKMARRERRLQDALNHFSVVVEQNDKHALSEVWREIGATYLEAGMHKEALDALENFVTRRPFDAEGLYYLGKVYKAQGEHEKARETFRQAIDAANNSPDYRRHEIRHWGKLAQKEI